MSKLRDRVVNARRTFSRPGPDPAQMAQLQEEIDRLEKVSKRLNRAAKKLSSAPRGGRGGGRRRGRRARQTGELADGLPLDFDDESKKIIGLARPYTMTSPDKLFALITAVRHLAATGVAGDIVECGVWRGGSMHAVAHALDARGEHDRDLYLFDTFEGMTAPTDKDVGADGTLASVRLEKNDRTSRVWAVASIEDVQEGIDQLAYPAERFHLVKGPVEETIPERAPDRIALLRLDTDWYESTRHELEHLYQRLVPGGVLIIDDYGSWQGSKQATDEFLAGLESPPMMLRAGRGRIGVKPAV